MSILQTIAQWSQQNGVPFLVIGGHAVNVHGYSRQTYDLDFLTRKDHRDTWKGMLLAQGYRLFREHDHFMQFTAPTPQDWPIDFMLVNETTFAGMWAEAVETSLDGVGVKVPSVRHLIALKLHVLKQALSFREVKDLHDVIQLIQASRIDVRQESFRQLCERYGNVKLYEELLRICGPS